MGWIVVKVMTNGWLGLEAQAVVDGVYRRGKRKR